MPRKLKLATIEGEPSRPPTIEAIREKLGGRQGGPPHPDTGSLVLIEGRASGPGVLLFVDEQQHGHVWVGEGRVRKVGLAFLARFDGQPPPELARVAGDVSAFASLREGERVSFIALDTSGSSRIDSGELLEKCRHGALVARPDGVVLGVGFRRLWRAPAHAD